MRLNQLEFEALNLELSISNKNDIERATKILNEVKPYYDCFLVYEVHPDNYFQYVEVFLKHDSLDMRINFTSYDKRFNVWCKNLDQFSNLTKWDVKNLCSSLIEPNNMKKLTTNKIKEWVQYYEKMYAIAEPVNEEYRILEELFKEKLKGFEIHWDDETSGEIRKNGIEYSFQINKTYIQQNISISEDVDGSIETFEKLADNGLAKKIKSKKVIVF